MRLFDIQDTNGLFLETVREYLIYKIYIVKLVFLQFKWLIYPLVLNTTPFYLSHLLKKKDVYLNRNLLFNSQNLENFSIFLLSGSSRAQRDSATESLSVDNINASDIM